ARVPLDIVRVDEADRGAPGTTVALIVEPFDRLVSDAGVRFLALTGTAVRRGTGAAGEAIRLKAALLGEVPLAVPVGFVALIAQHGSPGRDARVEPRLRRRWRGGWVWFLAHQGGGVRPHGQHHAGLVAVQPGQ